MRALAVHTRLLIPAYFHPAPHLVQWQALLDHIDRIELVVLNVDSGAGQERDPAFVSPVADLRRGGVRVLGYIDTDYGRRPTGEVLTDLQRYQQWYGIDGLFCDRVSTDLDYLEHYCSLSLLARRRGAATVAFNHGTIPAQGYAQYADVLGIFEGSWQAYLDWSPPRWVRAEPPDRFCHLIHSIPAPLLAAAWGLVGRRHAGLAYLTNHGGPNPWERLPANPQPPTP
jgi:hypothetical protein